MEDLTDIKYGPLPSDSPYCKPFRFHYCQNGSKKSWDMVKVQDSVAIIIFHKERNTLVLVKQFRPAIYYSTVSAASGQTNPNIDTNTYPAKLGITIELCAGTVDKSIPLIEIAQEEVLEECGYNVSVDRIEEVMTYRSDVGVMGALQTLFYCEVSDADKDPKAGGGIEDEIIEVVEYTIPEIRKMIKQGTQLSSPVSFLFGVSWFLANKVPS